MGQGGPALGQPGKAAISINPAEHRNSQVPNSEQTHPGRFRGLVSVFSILFLGQLLPKLVCLQEIHNHLYFFLMAIPRLLELFHCTLFPLGLVPKGTFTSRILWPHKANPWLGKPWITAHISLSRMTAASLPQNPAVISVAAQRWHVWLKTSVTWSLVVLKALTDLWSGDKFSLESCQKLPE